jgi:hypothetical protein
MKLIKKIINFYVGLEKDKSELLLIFKFWMFCSLEFAHTNNHRHYSHISFMSVVYVARVIREEVIDISNLIRQIFKL